MRILHSSLRLGQQARPRRIPIPDTGQRTIRNAMISRGVRNAGGLPFAKICEGVLSYNLLLSEMQRISSSPIAFVEASLRMCMCVCL